LKSGDERHPGSTQQHAGAVRFQPQADGTTGYSHVLQSTGGSLGRDLDTGSLAQDMFSIDKLDFATLASFSIIVGFPGGS
jgi:hypothetical protein